MLAGAGPALSRLAEAVGDLWDEGVEAVGTVGTALADLTGDADGLSAAISVVTDAPSASFTGCGAAASSGVLKMPGRIVLTRIASFERSRAIGRVMPTTPPFEAE